MYGLISKINAVPGQRDALAAILMDGTGGVLGCLSYVIARDPADDNALWITEVWDSQASHKASLLLPACTSSDREGLADDRWFQQSSRNRPHRRTRNIGAMSSCQRPHRAATMSGSGTWRTVNVLPTSSIEGVAIGLAHHSGDAEAQVGAHRHSRSAVGSGEDVPRLHATLQHGVAVGFMIGP